MEKNEIISPENLVYKKPTLMNDVPMHYCPGCSHGVVHKLVAEVIEEMGMEEKSIGVSPVGCAVFAYRYIDIDWQEAAHGRAPAIATAIKRLWPDRLVFTYQGDGDLACIGTADRWLLQLCSDRRQPHVLMAACQNCTAILSRCLRLQHSSKERVM